MSLTSVYIFPQGLFNGVFQGVNTPGTTETASTTVSGMVVTVHRPTAEFPVDLGPLVGTDAITGLVAKKLIAANASLTSGIRAQGRFWPAVEYFVQNPGAHPLTQILARIHFNFHIDTPWYCADADGTIGIYVFLFLDGGGKLKGKVDGTWFQYSGGGPFCTGKISDGLKAAMPDVKAQVQKILDDALAFVAGAKFSALYFMPGNGAKTMPLVTGNATLDLTVGLVPA